MKKECKKIALFGLAVAFACLSAQRASVVEEGDDVAMGKTEGGRMLESYTPYESSCPERDKCEEKAEESCDPCDQRDPVMHPKCSAD